MRRTGNRAIRRDVGSLVCRTMEIVGCRLLRLWLIKKVLRLNVLHGRVEVHPSSSWYAQFERIVVWVHVLRLRGIERVIMSISVTVEVCIVVETDLIDAIGRLTKVCLSLLLILTSIVCEPIVAVSRKVISLLLRLILVRMLLLLVLLVVLLLLLLLLLIR